MQDTSDEDSVAFYADPKNQQTTGRAVRRAGKALSTHVPVRFSPDMIAAVKRLADRDHMTVSAWIRRVVAREIERRLQPETRLDPTEAPVVVDYTPAEPFRSVTGSSNAPVHACVA
jgi:hypothetical protein